ncbi:uncharacterized protein MONOS_14807 [Monocercomonoides exilis]|uniref:uncharacterized protein n=1 Tax=Monocercomonoides exilis TaxID=2049356 RepID=UPI00355A69D0|nr:hypothetical protein MONOS_14807 [Monocercomonoides exilis]|eukprot:MONOS_14807.1-p1 / transcript=MONOS_14807.1 / gene=MONOS_14807 / organism=Monocercomonoides_exilis_PA203 / gene_product=unspecified product / transcript_product=unspecified product / location=Mono_scaffold01077:12887-13225(-) / protein_length=113 / sequence_SO=supercontig / SO=protein_coding / is_pseudo=false
MARVIAGIMKEHKITHEEKEECPKVSEEDEAKREQSTDGTLSEEESKCEEVEASMEELVEDVNMKTVRMTRTREKKSHIQGENDRAQDTLNGEQYRQEEEKDVFIIRTRTQV